jgi:ribosomal-protein-alanine N-acetyltransferase
MKKNALMGELVIRPMLWWDITIVETIEQELFPVDPWTAELFWAELAQVPDSRNVVVAEIDGEIAGYTSLRIVGSEADINTIAVATKFQNQGVGSQLYAWLEDCALSMQVHQLFLDVRSDNEIAIHMYQKLGFEKINLRKDYYATGISAIVMRKRLSNV